MDEYSAQELMPRMFFWTIVYCVTWFLILLIIIIAKQVLYPTTNVITFSTTSILNIIDISESLIVIISVFIFHEIVHAITSWIFGIPVKFGAGIMNFSPYLSVEPLIPVLKRNYYFIAIAPTIFINLGFIVLILFSNIRSVIFLLSVITFFLHFIGCAGDFALIETVHKYPKSILIKDTGFGLIILSANPLHSMKKIVETKKKSHLGLGEIFAKYVVIFNICLILLSLGLLLLTIPIGIHQLDLINFEFDTTKNNFHMSYNIAGYIGLSIVGGLFLTLIYKKS